MKYLLIVTGAIMFTLQGFADKPLGEVTFFENKKIDKKENADYPRFNGRNLNSEFTLSQQLGSSNFSVNLGEMAANLGQDRGGGDICENEIQKIGNDIAKWVHNGGHKYLKLPSNISHEYYFKSMTWQISNAKIVCVSDGDPAYPVMVYDTPKICVFNDKQFSITCDRKSFLRLTQSEQYVLIHHEYAGLGKIEPPNKGSSSYAVSNQISAYLEDTIVKKLVVKNLHNELIAGKNQKGFIYININQKYDNNRNKREVNIYARKCIGLVSGNNLTKNHCLDRGPTLTVPVNQSFSLEPGLYFLKSSWSERHKLVQIIPDEQVVINPTILNLKTIDDKLPGIVEKYFKKGRSFNIYDDYSDLRKRTLLEKNQSRFFKKSMHLFGYITTSTMLEAYYRKKIGIKVNDEDKFKNIYFISDPTAANIFEVINAGSQNQVWLNKYNKHGKLLKNFQLSFWLNDKDNNRVMEEDLKEEIKIIETISVTGSYEKNYAPKIKRDEVDKYKNEKNEDNLSHYIYFPGDYLIDVEKYKGETDTYRLRIN